MTRDQAVGPLTRSIRVDRMARAQGDFIVTATPEECAALASSLSRSGDQTGDLDELHRQPMDVGDRRHRPQRRERIVAGLDLDP